MQSRYYSPDSIRFINSDGLLGVYGDIQSTNMYAYCANNPITYMDPNGYRYVEGTTIDEIIEGSRIYYYQGKEITFAQKQVLDDCICNFINDNSEEKKIAISGVAGIFFTGLVTYWYWAGGGLAASLAGSIAIGFGISAIAFIFVASAVYVIIDAVAPTPEQKLADCISKICI